MAGPVQPAKEITMSDNYPPLPPFTRETAVLKIRGAEDGWNSCNPDRVSRVYTADSHWRNCAGLSCVQSQDDRDRDKKLHDNGNDGGNGRRHRADLCHIADCAGKIHQFAPT
jgi:Protein of unknown function (DUF1348)